MRKFIENINSRQEALDELKSWNLELDRDLLNVSRPTFYRGNLGLALKGLLKG